MNRKWTVIGSVLLVVFLMGQASAVQVSQTATPAKPKAKDRCTFNVSVQNNGTESIQAGVNMLPSWGSEDSLLCDQPGTRDELTSGDIPVGGKVTYHKEVNLALFDLKDGKSYNYSFLVVHWHVDAGGIHVNRTFYYTPNYTLTTASPPPPEKKTPGFEIHMLMAVTAMAILLVWRRHR